MEHNIPQMPFDPGPKPRLFRVWSYRIGYGLGAIALLFGLGALSEINTGPRERQIFAGFLAGTVVFGVPAAIAFLAGTFLNRRTLRKLPRHWIRFNLRTMLVLVTLVGLETWLWRSYLWPPPTGGGFTWLCLCAIFSALPLLLCFSILAWINSPKTTPPEAKRD